jgi:hypothetical protein
MAFYLQVNGLAATAEGTRKRCMELAERGHQQRPDAVVKLMKYDHKTNTDIFVQHLY